MAKESPFKEVVTASAVAPIVGVGLQAIGQIGGKRARKRARRQARQATEQQLAFQREQLALLEKQKDVYRSMEFTNPYEGMQNPFAENVFEDLTVNQQQAQFLAQQGAQQRADILGGLRGAAGSSGVAGLAQSLANQQQRQAQQISASIGQQEAANQRLRAQGALQVQKGQAAVDMAIRGGDAMVQQAEMARQATLLGVAYSGAAGANQSVQQAFANQMRADMVGQQMQADRFNALSDLAISASKSGIFDNFSFGRNYNTNPVGDFEPANLSYDEMYPNTNVNIEGTPFSNLLPEVTVTG